MISLPDSRYGRRGGCLLLSWLFASDLMNPRKRSSSFNLICTVCRGPGAGLHYGGIVCRSCRVFFFRAVRSNKPLTCKHNSTCTMSSGPPGRASCAACRFMRCLKANMDIMTVGDRIRKTSPEPGPSSRPSTSQRYTAHQGRSSQLSLQLVNLEMSVNSIDISNALSNSFPPLEESRHYYNWMARSYLDNSTFCSQISALPPELREVLVDRNLRLFGLFSQKYYSWLRRRLPSSESPKPSLEQIELLFEENSITNSQFAMLKLLCLLSPVLSLPPQDKWTVFVVYTCCIALLFQIVHEERPNIYVELVGKLLEIPKRLQTLL